MSSYRDRLDQRRGINPQPKVVIKTEKIKNASVDSTSNEDQATEKGRKKIGKKNNDSK